MVVSGDLWSPGVFWQIRYSENSEELEGLERNGTGVDNELAGAAGNCCTRGSEEDSGSTCCKVDSKEDLLQLVVLTLQLTGGVATDGVKMTGGRNSRHRGSLVETCCTGGSETGNVAVHSVYAMNHFTFFYVN